MWQSLVAIYQWFFKHAVAIAVILIAVVCFYLLMPIACEVPPERIKQARVIGDFRQLRIKLAAMETSQNVVLSIPLDPFAKGPSPYTLLISPKAVIAASVGPDGSLENNGIGYDPTNGSVSSGDILTTISTGNVFANAASPLSDSLNDH